MDYKEGLEEIKQCEIAYTKNFSACYENDNVIRFRDDQIQEMYYHNYTYLKKQTDESNIKQNIDDEFELRLSEKADFCLIFSDFPIDDEVIASLIYKADVSRNGYYSFDISRFKLLGGEADCKVERVTNQKMVDDILYCDLQHDEATLGKDFCTKRCYRRSKVYLADQGVNSYVCYHDESPVGCCDLLIHEDDTAKDMYQKLGFHKVLERTDLFFKL